MINNLTNFVYSTNLRYHQVVRLGSQFGGIISDLNIEKRAIERLLNDSESRFLIPDYQRPYAWTVTECQVLWDDLKSFAFPDDDPAAFDKNSYYFLGPIVTFQNEDWQEVIDGQQRITTIMLLLRAFYESFDPSKTKDKNTLKVRENIEECLWIGDDYGNVDKSQSKIKTLVATDNDLEDFRTIMKTGVAPEGSKSNYSMNYRFFMEKIQEFVFQYMTNVPDLPARIMKYCILLPIKTESQDSALMIFSTLNNRGKPLSDADIFKSQLYKHYRDRGEKDSFIERWKDLEVDCNEIFAEVQNNPLDELFTRYMYYERSLQHNKSSTTEGLRKFYEKGNYEILRRDGTFENLIKLKDFWKDVSKENSEKFSDDVLSRFFVLSMAPNGMWTYILSVYFMHLSDSEGNLNNDELVRFLDKIIGFIWTYAVINPGVNALRTPVFTEMVNIIDGKPVEFADHRFDENTVRNFMNNFDFTNQRPITRSMLAWWAFQQPDQTVLSIQGKYDIEHIFPRNRQEIEGTLRSPTSLEKLGNKSLLEKTINIRASDFHFTDKKGYYLGRHGRKKQSTAIWELKSLCNKDDFTETDILDRDKRIIDGLISFLRANSLLKK